MSRKRPVATTKTITVLRIDHHGWHERGPEFGIVDADGRKYHTKPGASFAMGLISGDYHAGNEMRLTLNSSGKVVNADWGEGLR